MMELTLAAPIYLTRQLARMKKATGLSLSQLQHLAYYYLPALGVITEDCELYHKFDLIELHEITNDEEDGSSYKDKEGLAGIPFLTGVDGIQWLCEQKGLDVPPLTKVSIPDSVFRECTRDQWYDISHMYADLEQRNRRVSRLLELRVPNAIQLPETMMLWQKVELLEAGRIGNRQRHWTHGRVVRSLNDIGYSLIDGWSAAMLEHFEFLDDLGKEEIEERRRQRFDKLLAQYTKRNEARGMSFMDALIQAHDDVRGNPSTRPASIEGMGIQIYDPFPRQIIADFLENHKLSFIKSDVEQKLYDRIISGEDLDTVFEDSNYELDGPEYALEHWAVAVANVMIRETGLSFGVHIADPDGKYKNRSCILFSAREPWLYNEKDKKLSSNMLYQILDRYALELGLTVWDSAYFVMDLEDD